jgi:hypothetical protein
MDKGFIETHEGVSAARMPDAAFSGIALMGNPNVSLEAFQLVVLGDLLRITDDLEDHHVSSVREDKGPLVAQRAVIGLIEEERVLVDEFFLYLVKGQVLKAALLLKADERVGPDAHKIALHRGGLDLQARDVAVVANGVKERLMVDAEMGPDEPLLKLGQDGIIEKGDLKEKGLIEGLLVDAEPVRGETHCCDTAAFAVAAVVHLHRRLDDMAAAYGDAASETGDAAPPLLCLTEGSHGGVILEVTAGIGD